MSMLVQDLGLSRRACDRCHGQKLHCIQENSNEGCLRCQRAGVQCVPRPVRSRQRVRPQATRLPPIQVNNPAQSLVNPVTDQASKDISAHFTLSPSSLLDFSSDLNLGLDFGSPQSELGPPLETRDLESAMDLVDMQNHDSRQSLAHEVPQDRGAGRSQQGRHNESHSGSQGSYFSPVPAPVPLAPYSEGPSNHSRQRLSQGSNLSDQDDTGMSFVQREGTVVNTDNEDTGTDSGYGPSVSHLQSSQTSIRGPYNASHKTARPIVNHTATSWVRKLSDINVELHQHMLSIPPIEIEPGAWTNTKDKRSNNGFNSTHHHQELAVDCTFQLSHQHMETLKDVFSRFKGNETQPGSSTANLGLDQPSQLLVLSSYLCLIESYDKILQHIKTWTDTRLKMGASSSNEHFSIQLPSLAIGSFKLPTCSSTQPLVLMCIIETMIMQIHNQVSEMMRPAMARNGSANMSYPATGKQGTSDANGLSGVAKVTLQAIRAKEDSTMKLLHVVRKHALRCDSL